MTDHEYSLIGHSRAHVGRWLGVGASFLGSAVTTLIIWLIGLVIAKGFTVQNLLVLPAIAGFIYIGLHFAFNKWCWRFKYIKLIFGFPDISGEWSVSGKTLNSDGETTHDWNATMQIFQTWEKLCITIKTNQSSSTSISASLVKTASGEYKLMYSYSNSPKIEHQKTLHGHVGYCELIFDKDCNSADGEYFNNRGRTSFGSMKIQKVS